MRAVFCLGFSDDSDPKSAAGPIQNELKEKIEALSDAMKYKSFKNAFDRVLLYQAQMDLLAAGAGPFQLRNEISRFLSKLKSALGDSGKESPDVIYIQLVDRRRNLIRTIQGYGFPLSFITSATQKLESDDVLSRVVNTGSIYIISGYDPEMLDRELYDKYRHKDLARLWMPLFPVRSPAGSLSDEDSFSRYVDKHFIWENPQTIDKNGLRQTGIWQGSGQDKIPDRLIYGVIEIGYRRPPQDSSPSLSPFSKEHATWCVATALRLSHTLYPFTLSGSLEKIGRSVSRYVKSEETHLLIAMPDWDTPEIRRYPIDEPWAASVPSPQKEPRHPLPKGPGLVKINNKNLNCRKNVDAETQDPNRVVIKKAEEGVRLAFQLDDLLFEPLSLLRKAEMQKDVGTSFPEHGLDAFLGEVCRETGASAASYLLFDDSEDNSKKNYQLVGVPTTWPHETSPPTDRDTELAYQSISDKKPLHKYDENAPDYGSALPLELLDGTIAVLMLNYGGREIPDQSQRFALEGRISRWRSRLSLRRQIVMNRFSNLMETLHSEFITVRNKIAAGQTGNASKSRSIIFMEHCLQALADRLYAVGAVMTIYSTSSSSPSLVERYCAVLGNSDGNTNNQKVMGCRNIFENSPCKSPAIDALNKNQVVSYIPDDPLRKEKTRPINKELRKRADTLREYGKQAKVFILNRIADLAEEKSAESTTMIVCPAWAFKGTRRQLRAAFSVFVKGRHYFNSKQERLILSLSNLIAEALEHLIDLDKQNFELQLRNQIETFHKNAGDANTVDDLVKAFLYHLGFPDSSEGTYQVNNSYWNFSDHVVLWLNSRDGKELVARSARGDGLCALHGMEKIVLDNHPFFNPKETNIARPQTKNYPKLKRFKLIVFSLDQKNPNPLLNRYAGVNHQRWLYSFPIMHNDGTIYGVIDCLREKRYLPEQEAALKAILGRVMRSFCQNLDRVRREQTEKISRKVSNDAAYHLQSLHVHDVYKVVVEYLRNFFKCIHCDLFWKIDNRMVLIGSTRFNEPIDATQRNKLVIRENDGDEPLGRCLLLKKFLLVHKAKEPTPLQHFSPHLQELYASDFQQEKLVIPLFAPGKVKEDSKNPKKELSGMIYLTGPLGKSNLNEEGYKDKCLKKVFCSMSSIAGRPRILNWQFREWFGWPKWLKIKPSFWTVFSTPSGPHCKGCVLRKRV